MKKKEKKKKKKIKRNCKNPAEISMILLKNWPI